MLPVLKLVYTICLLVYTYSFSTIFYLYFYLFVTFWYLYALILYIYLYLCTFCLLFAFFLVSLCTFQLVLHYVFIMFSSLYSKRTEKTSQKFFSKNLKKVLTYKLRYGNIRHVKRKDVKTDRQTPNWVLILKKSTSEKNKKKIEKVVDKLKKLCYS